MSRRIGKSDAAPELSAGYSVASGDRDRNDGRWGAFDDLYSGGYNGCGLPDPFAWRNLRDANWGAGWQPGSRWHLATEVHHYWLSTVRDAVYGDDGTALAYSPHARSSRLGAQANAMAQYRLSRFWKVSLGCARFFPGPYMRAAALAIASKSAFLALEFRM